MKEVAVAWTGGKDCTLALHEAIDSGMSVRCLVTFAPPDPLFRAHPLPVMQRQARSLGLPHRVLTVDEPYERGYENALRALRDDGIAAIVTGDIAEVDGQPNWMRERGAAAGLQVCTPLWGRERNALLDAMLARGFRILVSCVDTRRLDAAWVGRALDAAAVAELRALAAQTGIDACGENGEYHTLVTDGPGFRRRVAFGSSRIDIAGTLAWLRTADLT